MSATGKLVIAADWQSALAGRGFEDLWNLPGMTMKRAASTEVLRARLGDRDVFVKKYWANSFRQQWSGALRGSFVGKSKVQREFDNLQRLRAWKLDAPEPAAYGEDREAGWLKRSFLVTAAIANATPLDSLILGKPPYELLDRLADYVRRLHEHRFVHHDLYWRNIILSGGSLNHFYLIDAHKGRVWRDELAGRAQDLAMLDAPAPAYFRRTERLRFFLRYRDHERLTDEDKKLIARVLALAGPLRDRQLKRIREARR